MPHVPFPSIDSFSTVAKRIHRYPHHAPGPVTYHAKVKLHGTNAGVRIGADAVTAQSRTQDISCVSDNCGFAAWVASHADYWSRVETQCTVFGEWVGPGIQKGCAVHKLPHKVFAVFAVKVDNRWVWNPEEIAGLLPPGFGSSMQILPYHGCLTVTFGDRESMSCLATNANLAVQGVEPEDPWVKDTFGVSGIGEGLVYAPETGDFESLVFKAKGDAHKVAERHKVAVDPAVLESVEEFTRNFVTEGRCQQGRSLHTEIGEFLKWLSADVAKESVEELAASNLTWDQVRKAVPRAAAAWWKGVDEGQFSPTVDTTGGTP